MGAAYDKRFPDWKEKVVEASENTNSAAEAAAYLNIKYDTYKKYAIKYDCFKTNQSSKGIKRGTKVVGIIPLEDILTNKVLYPNRQSLKRRLISAGLLVKNCYICGIDTWLDNPLSLHLDHINGINNDNRLENLRLLCPNCHSQTGTYCGKNKGLMPG